MTVLQSPRRLRAKYTPRTNLRFVLWVFRPCGELPYQRLQEIPAAFDTALFRQQSRRNSSNRQDGCKMRTVYFKERLDYGKTQLHTDVEAA